MMRWAYWALAPGRAVFDPERGRREMIAAITAVSEARSGRGGE